MLNMNKNGQSARLRTGIYPFSGERVANGLMPISGKRLEGRFAPVFQNSQKRGTKWPCTRFPKTGPAPFENGPKPVFQEWVPKRLGARSWKRLLGRFGARF